MAGKQRGSIVVVVALAAWISGCGSSGTSAGTTASTAGTTATTASTTGSTTATTAATTTTTAPARQVTLVFPRPTATGFDFIAVDRKIPAAGQVEVAALQALLAGPTPEEVTAQQVTNPFAYSSAIKVRSVTVSNGTATADFSKELLAYGGGSANVQAISGSITETLKRFAGVSKVVILVEGKADQLQP